MSPSIRQFFGGHPTYHVRDSPRLLPKPCLCSPGTPTLGKTAPAADRNSRTCERYYLAGTDSVAGCCTIAPNSFRVRCPPATHAGGCPLRLLAAYGSGLEEPFIGRLPARRESAFAISAISP